VFALLLSIFGLAVAGLAGAALVGDQARNTYIRRSLLFDETAVAAGLEHRPRDVIEKN
jgi:hypothetical protein